MPVIVMDVLSEVLKVIKLDGALFFNAELSAPWCLREPSSEEFAPLLGSPSGHIVIYHYVMEGRGFARLSDERRVELAAGDIVVFPHGDFHFLGNGRPEKPVDAKKAFAPNLYEGLKLARHGGGGEITRLVCGYMVCEPRLSGMILAGLPKILKVPIGDEPSGKWLKDSIRFSVGEGGDSDAGSGLVLAKLSEVLFVETLRRFINSLPEGQTGWLAGARDPAIGVALALLHAQPSHPWTISDLAKRVGLSRTLLSERFRYYLEDSPMAYLTKWRLTLGAESLLSSDAGIAEIAASVGYGSESAFNRAFKREYNFPPAHYRRKQGST